MNEIGSDIMLKKQTTNVAILLGLSVALTSGSASANSYIYNEDELVACNYKFNNPEKVNNARIDEYFNEFYNMKELLEESIIQEDIEFLGIIQNFADSQIDLDNDFKSALNNLTLKAGKKQPTKKRF